MALNKRQRQLEHNLDWILGGYMNGMTDCGEEEYPKLSDDEAIQLCKNEVYDMWCSGHGMCHYEKGICKDLKFLGNDYINDRILTIAAECGILKD